MDIIYILQTLIGACFLIIGFFLKSVYNKIMKLDEKTNTLETKTEKHAEKLENLTNRIPAEIDNIKEIMNLHHEELKRAIAHAEKSVNNQSVVFKEIITILTKQNKQ